MSGASTAKYTIVSWCPGTACDPCQYFMGGESWITNMVASSAYTFSRITYTFPSSGPIPPRVALPLYYSVNRHEPIGAYVFPVLTPSVTETMTLFYNGQGVVTATITASPGGTVSAVPGIASIRVPNTYGLPGAYYIFDMGDNVVAQPAPNVLYYSSIILKTFGSGRQPITFWFDDNGKGGIDNSHLNFYAWVSQPGDIDTTKAAVFDLVMTSNGPANGIDSVEALYVNISPATLATM